MEKQKTEKPPILELTKPIFSRFTELYYEKYGVKPSIAYSTCLGLLSSLLKDYTPKTLIRVIELYFEKEPDGRVFHLPSILSSWCLNKYLPMTKLNSDLYVNAEELNKELK
mgnify:CR=1 FL=1